MEKTKERHLFYGFDNMIVSWEELNKKRFFPERERRKSAENTLRFRNTINLSESDIYAFSLKRNELRNNVKKIKAKYDKIKEKHEDCVGKFTASMNILNLFEKHKNTLIESKCSLK